MFALPISKPRFKSISFCIKIAQKLSYFWKKMQSFRALGAPPPDPQNSPPISNFWLRACPAQHLKICKVFICKVRYNMLRYLKHENFSLEMEKFLRCLRFSCKQIVHV